MKPMPKPIYCFRKKGNKYEFWIEVRTKEFKDGSPAFWKQTEPIITDSINIEAVGAGWVSPPDLPDPVGDNLRALEDAWRDYLKEESEATT